MKTIAAKHGLPLADRVEAHLNRIYTQADTTPICQKALDIFGLSQTGKRDETNTDLPPWTQEDIILITYGNSIVHQNQTPLKTLHQFIAQRLGRLATIVHILPFFPYSSDDGFAVMDYYEVNPSLGDWNDIQAFGKDYRLMADLVVNHTSSRAKWFENFKKGIDPGKDFYQTVEPDCDLSQVVRPRTSPLLREVMTPDGPKQVWCTFSHDQIDLNFQNPEVLLEFLRIIRYYLDQGVTVFRLDAVAFLWKESCTTCLHLDQTHEIIKLFRTLIEAYNPCVLIITETNVPSTENLSYLGNCDEAHVVYNFPLPPFLLYTLVTGSSGYLVDWLAELPDQPAGTSCLNFIASHDGIGLRPVEGYLDKARMTQLNECMINFGGKISTRALNDQESNPYEINISLWDALKGTIENGPDDCQLERFVCAHAVMLALKGIPAFYIHSIMGTENDYDRRENLQSNRAVNRHIWDKLTLDECLDDTASHHCQVYHTLTRLMAVRKKQPAFHPDAVQRIIKSDPNLVVFRRQTRQSDRSDQTLLCIYNISDQPVTRSMSEFLHSNETAGMDLISDTQLNPEKTGLIRLAPYQSAWIQIESVR